MIKIGHRGAKGYVAENTLPSFQKALQLGVDMIELDVHNSKDNVPVIIHDNTIDRTTNGRGPVSNFTIKELHKFNVPSLEDVFKLVNSQCEINIEIKEHEAAQGVLKLIEKYSLKNGKSNFLISSFDWNILKEVHLLNKSIRIGVLTETDLDLAFSFAKFIKAYSIHPYYKLLTTEKTKQIQAENFKVFAWTVNEPEDIIFAKSLNVDGIITDFPDRI